MKTVNEVSKITGVSIRTLHYYDEIGLLSPAVTTDAGYRLYDDACLERLQQILLFRELEFPLKEIRKILNSEGFDKKKALDQQIELLTLKKERMEKLLTLAEQMKKTGGKHVSFQEFDKKKLEEYAAEARKTWGNTDAYKEYERKSAGYSDTKQKDLARDMMQIFADFGTLRAHSPEDKTVQALVQRLQDFITANYYTCTKQILSGLGQMYAAGTEMTENIDAAGGAGTAEFASKAIAFFCR